MNISQASEQTGLPVRTLRYYEEKGLVQPGRSDNDYRDYQAVQIQELIFLRRCRQFGFSLQDCEQLLDLFRNPRRQSHDVHSLASKKLLQMTQHIEELINMRDDLQRLISQCANDEQSQCAIIHSLAESLSSESNKGHNHE